MRKLSLLAATGLAVFMLSLGSAPETAQARCKTFHASHNGTDFFYDTGTEGTVKNKLIWYVEQWQKENNIEAGPLRQVSHQVRRLVHQIHAAAPEL